MPTERALTTTPAYDPDLDRAYHQELLKSLPTNEATRFTIQNTACGFEALGAEVTFKPRMFYYTIETWTNGELRLFPSWDKRHTPALLAFEHAVKKNEADPRKYAKHVAELEGMHRLEKEIVLAAAGSTYLLMSPRDPDIAEYAHISKIWVGIVSFVDDIAAVRVLDLPIQTTLSDHQRILDLLGERRLASLLQTPNDFVRTPIVFHRDANQKTPKQIIEVIQRVTHLPDDTETLVHTLMEPPKPPSRLAFQYAHEMFSLQYAGVSKDKLYAVFDNYLKAHYASLAPTERTGIFATASWEAFYRYGRPLELWICGGGHRTQGIQTAIEQILDSINEGLDLEENTRCPNEHCRWSGWKDLKKGEHCHHCGLKRVC
ncbi:MAG: hypothetical protein Q8R11_01110 [bacterium]|nr:hypothetical protein [bacterium]